MTINCAYVCTSVTCTVYNFCQFYFSPKFSHANNMIPLGIQRRVFTIYWKLGHCGGRSFDPQGYLKPDVKERGLSDQCCVSVILHPTTDLCHANVESLLVLSLSLGDSLVSGVNERPSAPPSQCTDPSETHRGSTHLLLKTRLALALLVLFPPHESWQT